MAQPHIAWTELTAAYTAVPRLRRNRRAEERYTVPRSGVLHIRLVPTTRLIEAELRNVSLHGASLATQTSVTPGTYISFQFSGARVFAEVRHCRFTRIGFVLGARVTDVISEDGEAGTALKL